MKITLSFATSAADLDALGDEWEELADRCPHARFFQRPGWCRAWWRAVAEGRPGYGLAVAAVRDRPGALVALAPLMVRDTDGRRELCFLADPYTDYHDVLCLPGHMDSALELVWQGLRERGGWDTCALREVPMASPTADWLAGIARTVPVAELHRASTCPTLDLRDEEAYRRAVSKYEYRSKARKLAALGPVECTHLSEPSELRRYFPEFRQMHLDQWQGRPDAVGSFDDEEVTAFFVRLIDEVGPSGDAVLTRFCVDGRPAAYYWGFRDRDCYRAYRTAYDVSLSRYSPGAVMLRHMLLDFPESGYRTFDFMRGGYGYKSRFANGTNQNVSLELLRPAAQGRPAAVPGIRPGHGGGAPMKRLEKARKTTMEGTAGNGGASAPSVCVYCSSHDGSAELGQRAYELGRGIAERGWHLVYGGGAAGLMGRVAEGAHSASGVVIGITLELTCSREGGAPVWADTTYVESVRDRKERMETRSDAFVVLPGGLGTLEELLEILSLKQLKFHDRPVVLVNSGDYWAPLLAQLDRAVQHFGYLDVHGQCEVVPDFPSALAALDGRLPRASAATLPRAREAEPGQATGTPARFDHVRLDVRDMVAAEAFYTRALGLSEVVRYDVADRLIVQLAADGTPPGVELWQEKGLEPAPHPTEHLAFAVPDVPSLVERVRVLGYRVLDEPFAVGAETVAFVADPDGHRIELNDFRGRP